MMMRRNYQSLTLLAMASLAVGSIAVFAGGQGVAAGVMPAGTVFTYQGQLIQGGVRVNDTGDFEFSLWDAAIGPTQIGSTLSVNNITITDGLFTVQLDFGGGAFNGNARWLEVAVRTRHDPSDTELFTTLSPRQPLTPAPYAVRSLAPWAVSPTNKSDIFYETGNVGIGKTAPQAKLDVVGIATTGTDAATVRAIHTGPGVPVADINNLPPAGVRGEATATTGITAGVLGISAATDGVGVVGASLATSGETIGIVGLSQSVDGAGVVAQATATTGITTGLEAIVFSPDGTAGHFLNDAGGDVLVGVVGPEPTFKVVFRVDGSGNLSLNGIINASGPSNIAGNLQVGGNLSVSGTLSKGAGMFKIDHPLDPQNKYLQHSFVESPDMMNVYNGNIVLDDRGEGTVILPPYFEALNGGFRYQLTCIGGFAPIFVAEEIQENRFKIAGGDPQMRVSWQVTGIRQDPYAQANRIPVEKEKPEAERGGYLHPEVYGVAEAIGPTARANHARDRW